MDPATLTALLAFVAQVAPELLAAITDIVHQFQSVHPSLNAPPPADGEAAVNAQVDTEISKQFDK